MDHYQYDKISFNLPHELLEKIDRAAAQDHRSRTSWLIHNLEKVVHETPLRDQPAPAPAPPPDRPVKYPRKKP